MRVRPFIIALALVGVVCAAMFFMYPGIVTRFFFAPTESAVPGGVSRTTVDTKGPQEGSSVIGADTLPLVSVVAEDLDIPWELVFLPDGDMLVTERPGRLVKIGQNGKEFAIEGVHHVGEGGLLGLALHPAFKDNHYVYLYMTTLLDGGVRNRIERYVLEEDRVAERTVILDRIPGATYHDGGRIAFGPDGMLYVATGDASVSGNARRTDTLGGKILRITDEGGIPEDNPFGNEVWSYGHRNPQGLTWDDRGRLWSSEHGRSGAQTGMDEINLIVRGADYGWPVIEGSEIAEGMVTPVADSGANETWAPGDIAWFGDDRLLFTGLRGESLYEGRLSDDGTSMEIVAHFRGDFGRLRAITIGPDGGIYLTTSNTDGRGDAGPHDDRIIRISSDALRTNE